jgi:hypothetical protein
VPEVETEMKKLARYTDFGELAREEALLQLKPLLLKAPGIPAIKRCELYNKYRPLVPAPFRDVICPKPPQEILDNQKKIKNEKVRARAQQKKKKPAKKEKEKTADETREEDGAVVQQVAVAAAAGPEASTVVTPVMPPRLFNPNMPQQFNPYFFGGGFSPFNSFNNNI